MASGRAQLEALADDVEFPRLHPQRIGRAAATWSAPRGGRGSAACCTACRCVDTHDRPRRRFDYGAQVVAEEHIVVPKPGAQRRARRLAAGHRLRRRARRSRCVNLLDAAHVDDGPIAQAVLPYTLPFGFHGNFTAA